VRIQSGVAENLFLPCGLPQIPKNIFKRNRRFAFVPGPRDSRLRRGEISRLCVPQQYEVIDIEDEGSGSLSGAGDSVLRVFKAEKLFDVVEADLQGPAQSKGFEYLCRFETEIGGEEAVVAAAGRGLQRYAAIAIRRWNTITRRWTDTKP
jgi:hypothetical protein